MDPVSYGVLVVDYERSQERCSHCGSPRSECNDPERLWYPQRSICRAEMEAAAAHALYAQMHEKRPYHDGTFRNWSENLSPLTPYKFDDGVSIWAAPVDLNPDDKFLSSGEVVVPDGGEA